MSAAIMRGVLRGRLGFNGLTLSDCMVMDAIRALRHGKRRVVAALLAGVDIVLCAATLNFSARALKLFAAAVASSTTRICMRALRVFFDAKAKSMPLRMQSPSCAAVRKILPRHGDISRRAITRARRRGHPRG